MEISVFTTRPDTLYGVTFLALAPEHPLALEVTAAERRQAVAAYVAEARRRSDVERQRCAGEQRAVFTGAYALHPLTGEEVSVWVADYVLPGYGSGAIMGVPAHDERDHAFARWANLPIAPVIVPEDGGEGRDECYTGPGVMINSGPYDGLASEEGAERITADLRVRGAGRRAVTYKMRDWLISRQRYWGAPIPIVHCPSCGAVPVPEEDLPVLLPEADTSVIDDFAPSGDGRSPLARATEWVHTECPQCGGAAHRETDTMDGFACSSWYFLRFASPHEEERPFDPQAVRYWLPVDTYVGGAEHAVLHLLYARFWTKVMADAGLIDFVEPFSQLRNQGVLHAADGRRMSKSRGNVITPDEVVEEHGTDALRTYIVFIGPFEANVTWDDSGIRGVTRFLDRFWTLADGLSGEISGDGQGQRASEEPFVRQMHHTIRRVTEDLHGFKFNTAVAALMEWLNDLYRAREAGGVGPQLWRRALETFAVLLAPIAPFISEEVWQEVLGHEESVHRQAWPEYDARLIASGDVTVAVQVNGRLRDTISVPAGMGDEDLRAVALAQPNVRRHLDGKTIRRTIVVPDRIVNFVV